jgi:hypothetical protein
MNTDQRILEERALINALDASLDARRAPYLKSQLRFAGHMLDDAQVALAHAAKAGPTDAGMWLGFAEINIENAIQRREKVEDVINKYGGASNVMEIAA